MKTSALVVLAVVTAGAVAAAAASVQQRAPASRPAPGGGEPVFQSLAGKPDAIAEIKVERAETSYTLAKKGDKWVIADRADFPARTEQVNQAAAALAALKLVESKTQRAALLSRLEVEEPKAAGSKSTLVTLKNAQGAEIGKIILGKTRPDSLESPRPGVYARKVGDTRAWLAEGDPKIRATASDWVERGVVELKQERVQTVTTTAAGGEKLVVTREKAEDKDYKLDKLPEGLKLKSQGSLNDLGTTLDTLLLEDMRPVDEISFPAQPDRAEFKSFDGLTVTLTLAKVKDDVWVRVEAVGEGEAAKKEADGINARIGKYAFKVAEGVGKKLLTRLAEVTEKEEKKS